MTSRNKKSKDTENLQHGKMKIGIFYSFIV